MPILMSLIESEKLTKSEGVILIKEKTIMHTTRPVTDESFEREVLQSKKPVLVDFWASWCPPCHMIAPSLEEFAGEYGDKIEVVKLSVEENQIIPAKYRIMSIPTLMVFEGGEVKKVLMGAMPKVTLEAQLAEFLDAPQ